MVENKSLLIYPKCIWKRSQICTANCCSIIFRDLNGNVLFSLFTIQTLSLTERQKMGIKTRPQLTGTALPCRVITKSVLSSGSLATSSEHLALALRSYAEQKSRTLRRLKYTTEQHKMKNVTQMSKQMQS